MAITLVSGTGVAAGGLNGATTSAVDTTGANLLVIVATYNVGAPVTISDSKGNTYTGLTARSTGVDAVTRIYYCAGATVGTGHTFTIAATGNAPAIAVAAFAGAHASPFDAESGAADGSAATTTQPGSLTPSENDCLVINGLGMAAASTPSINAGTIDAHISFAGGSNYGSDIAHLIQTTAAASNPTWTHASGNSAAAQAAFKAASALTSGTASQTSTTASAIALSCTAASGGTPSYTYQWYRSTTANFTPGGGNILSGETSLTLTDSAGLSAGTTYYYKLRATDSATGTADSNEVAGTLKSASLSIGFIGDSITNEYGLSAGEGPAAQCGVALSKLRTFKTVTITNRGVDGAETGDWLSGGANLPGAKTAFASASVTHVHIMLGANDAAAGNLVSASTFGSNLDDIIADLTGAGYKVILSYPTYIPAGANSNATTAASVALTQSYQAQIDSRINGNTVLRGDVLSWSYFQSNLSEYQSDATHPTATGGRSLGTMWARAIDAALNPIPFPSSTRLGGLLQ